MPPRSPRILVLDDDALILAQVLDALATSKFGVVTASSAAQALTLLAEQPPFDLILADLQRPGMDGFEFRRRLRANPRTAEIPFCFLTASVRNEDKNMARQLGARAFLRKPVNAARILAFVREIIEEAAAADQRRLGTQVIARRLKSLGMAFQLTPDGTSLRAELDLPRAALSKSFSRAPIPSVTMENVDHERLRFVSPPHLMTLPPLAIADVADVATLRRMVIEAYYLHARARRREKTLLERWGITTEYDDDGCRFLGRVKVGRDEIVFTAVNEKTILILGCTGRVLGKRSRELDISGAGSSVEITFTLEQMLRSLPVAPAVEEKARAPDLALKLPEEDPEPPPLVSGHITPEPPPPPALPDAAIPEEIPELEADALLEPILVLAEATPQPVDHAPASGDSLLRAVCIECGSRFLVPDEMEDERGLTTCERCLSPS